MKLLEILYGVLAEGRFVSIGPKHVFTFNKTFKLSPDYKKHMNDFADKLAATKDGFSKEKIIDEKRKYTAKGFLDSILTKLNLKSLKNVSFEIDKNNPNRINIISNNIKGYITFKDTSIKGIIYPYVDLENTKIDYNLGKKTGVVHVVVPKDSKDKQYRISIYGTSRDEFDDIEDDDKLRKYRTNKPKQNKTEIDYTFYKINTNWKIFLFNKLSKMTGTLPNQSNIIFKRMEEAVKLLVGMLENFETIKPDELDEIKTEVKDMQAIDEKGQKKYSAKRGPLQIETYINPNDYTIDPTKTTVTFNSKTIYPIS